MATYNTSCDFTDTVRGKASSTTMLFCRLLVDATVMIVGDSLSWEHYMIMVRLLGLETHHGFQQQSRFFRTNIVQHIIK